MNVVVAVDADWGIGIGGTQPVVVPEDRKHFREVTGHGTVIVGLRTLRDFPGGRPLKNRRNIILSDVDIVIEGGEVARSLDEAIALARQDPEDEVFVIGGASIYRQLLPYCKRAFITRIEATPEVDTYFPNLDELPNWSVEDPGEEREFNGIKYRFMTYVNSDVKE